MLGIEIEAFGSDGDPKYVKAMKIRSKFPTQNAEYDWFYVSTNTFSTSK